MSSTNEELPPPPKPRASPLDFRNTDLVSRLLAATPPYLYNMPMVPNSYFFSEMLRSFVQAKSDPNRMNAPPTVPQTHRRSRKRSWTQARADYFQKESPNMEKPEIPTTQWKPPEKNLFYDTNKRTEVPLELTIEKPKINEIDYQKLIPPPVLEKPNIPMMFPTIPQESNQNLILPPPPPIWYPPLYPAPYGIDPLHFFIDLRVSGHIYDRKNGKVATPPIEPPPPQPLPQPSTSKEGFKQSRHASAFSVPNQILKNTPINLSNQRYEENKPLKFDVKSMGFEKACNKTGTHYIMKSLAGMYKELHECKKEPTENEEHREETEEEKEKRVKDLRALIGLELVVDYMNHAKPGQQTSDDSTTDDNESAPSPPLEVVTVHEEIPQQM